MAGKLTSVARKLALLQADRQGATAIEYGLIIGVISVAVIAGLETIQGNLLGVFQLISDTFATFIG